MDYYPTASISLWRRAWWLASLLGALLLLIWFRGSQPVAYGQDCITEAEPNDEPDNAQQLTSCATGTLGAEDQDLYRFTISEPLVSRQLTLDGIPAALTRAELFLVDDDGQPRSVYALQSPSGDVVASPELLLGAGDYLIGIAPAGGVGAYRVDLEAGGALPTDGEQEPNDRQDEGTAVSGEFSLLADGQGSVDWYTWTLSEGEAARAWQLDAQGPLGGRIGLMLHDSEGNRLVTTSEDSSGTASLYDLQLPAGAYLVRVDGERDRPFPYVFQAQAQPVLQANQESEPNNSVERAVVWDGDGVINGRLAARNDDDFYTLTVTESLAEQRFGVQLRANGRQTRTLCLIQPDIELNHCRTAVGEITLPDLVLPQGSYFIRIDGDADPEAFYQLSLTPSRPVEPTEEREPNDTYQFASPFGENLRASGRLVGDEWDLYRLEVSGAPQLWRLQAVGEGVSRLALINTAGQITEQFSPNQPQRRLRLSNLYLLPGTHFIGVRGSDVDYQLLAIPLGPPPEGLELEPNTSVGQANQLTFDQPRLGLLNEAVDRDLYRFRLAATERLRLTVTAPDDGNVRFRLRGDEQVLLANWASSIPAGQPHVWEGELPPGEYWVDLSSDVISDSPYTLQLERLHPFAPLDDLEPNDRQEIATLFPASYVAQGTLLNNNDLDWYRLPTVTQPTELRLTIDPPQALRLYDQTGQWINEEIEWDADAGRLTGELTSNADYFVRVQGNGAYRLELELVGLEPPESEPTQLAGDLELELEGSTAAAFWPTGQQLNGRLTISGAAAAVTEIEWHTSHYKIRQPRILEEAETVGGGREIRFAVDIEADVPSGVYPLSVRLANGEGGSLIAQAALEFDPLIPSQQPQRLWQLPDEMLGGLNLADLTLGAQVSTPDRSLADQQVSLHDGYTPLQSGLYVSFDGEPLELTIDLVGDEALPVQGITLNPQGRGASHEKLKGFELALSTDGVTFDTVLIGELQPIDIEQAFPLPEAVQARFARLRLLSNHNGNQGAIALGEWKVVAAADFGGFGEVNLADPVFGGHLVAAFPQPANAGAGLGYLLADGRSPWLDLRNGAAAAWVLGFQHQRVAQLSRLEWVEGPQTNTDERLTAVRVLTSLESPVGPWEEVAVFDLDPGTTSLTFEQPLWARYMRLEATGAGGERFRPYGPDVIRLFERQPDDTYRSILGEWGHYSQASGYELGTPLPTFPMSLADSNDTKAEAELVENNAPVDGQVTIGADVDWFRIETGPDENAVLLELTGNPTVDVQAFFENEQGELLPAAVDNSLGSRRLVTATVPAESTVYFRIEEPPRSVVFIWDTSGSVGPYVDTIYGSLARFVEGVTPGLETANFLPFGGELLLDTWGEEPTALQQALTNYPRGDGSSAAEETLLTGTEALAFQEGTRAVVLITDAESPSYLETAELWRALEAVQPRVFTVSINTNISIGDRPANQQDLMQNWARVNGGYYDFLRTQGEMALAFERASAWLRRPAEYRFVAQTAFVEPPGPGTLQLLSSSTGENEAASAALLGETAVEIIVDASGSMQQPLGDSTRIEVARGVLNELISDVLPDELPVALRVFGNREGNLSCRTDLEIPLQPLDRQLLSETVAAITPQDDANTAIGASLALVAEDLAGVEGPRLVILLTDGEETCGGDPEAEIAALRASGIDVRVNIVGFAIDNEALKAEFASWAETGGGAYFDAADSEALGDSLTAALRTPYEVFDASGTVVASGFVDGDPISLPPGVYTARIYSEPQTEIAEIVVPGETAIVVRVQVEE